jgi:DNA-binding response OmpR family regulator
MKVLIVDDEHLVRWFLDKALRKKGHEVITASSVAKAAEKLDTEAVDMMFVDLRMAQGNGMELIRKVCGSAKKPGIVVCSAFVTRDVEEDLIKNGIYVLRKPFGLEELYEALDSLGAS